MCSRLFALCSFAILVALSGCHHATGSNGPKADTGGVSNLPAFEAFIATHPTAEQFKAEYPGVQLMMPGMISTMEIRYDNSRFFPRWDKDGYILGGDFH